MEESGEEEGERRELFSSPLPTGEENVDQIPTSKRVTSKMIHLKPSSEAVLGLKAPSSQQR